MTVRVITPPEPLVDLATAKAHLRVLDTASDTLITAYIAAASAHIDGPGGWLGRAIGPQTLEASFDSFDCHLIRLPYPPVTEITSITYDDVDGVEQTTDSGAYSLSGDGALLAYGTSWPSARSYTGAVRIQYEAGYETIPDTVTAAVLLMVADLFANRETVGEGLTATPMSTTVERLLGPLRVWSL